MIHTLHPRAHRDWALLMRYLKRLVGWLQDHGWTLEDEDTDDPDRLCLNLRRGDEDCRLRLILRPQRFVFEILVEPSRQRSQWEGCIDPRRVHDWLQAQGFDIPPLFLQAWDVVRLKDNLPELGRRNLDLGIVTHSSPEILVILWGEDPPQEYPWEHVAKLHPLL